MGISNPGTPIIQDEGVLIALRQKLNFTGAGVEVANDTTNQRVNITISGASVSAHGTTHGAGGSDAIGTFLAYAAIPTISAQRVGTGKLNIAQLPEGSLGCILRGVGSGYSPTYALNFLGISAILDGGGTLVGSGEKVELGEIPFAGTIKQVTLLGDAAGSIFVNFKLSAYASYPTLAVIGTISLANTQKAQDATLSGWTTAIADGDVLEAYVLAGASGVNRVTATLKVEKS